MSTMTDLNQKTLSGQPSKGNAQLIGDLEKIVGARHVLTTPSATCRFRKGFRFGDGPALAVVHLGSLVEMWQSLRACSEAATLQSRYRTLIEARPLEMIVVTGRSSRCTQ